MEKQTIVSVQANSSIFNGEFLDFETSKASKDRLTKALKQLRWSIDSLIKMMIITIDFGSLFPSTKLFKSYVASSVPTRGDYSRSPLTM